jgi:hypothetical protein
MKAYCAAPYLCLISLLGVALGDGPPAKTKQEVQAAAFLAALSSHFDAWDASKDGLLQTSELAAAISNAAVVGDEAAAVAAVKRASRSKGFTMPLTLENLKKLTLAAPAKDQPNLGDMFEGGRKKIAAADKQLFPQGTPRLEALHQGKLGDCFCLAPLGAMLRRDPTQVEAMFKLQPDGSCDVRLGKNIIRVTMPTDAEIAMSSSTEASGIWSNAYEKAAGMARNAERPEKDRVDLPTDAIARGGSAGTMLAFITGHEIVRFSCKFARDKKVTAEDSALKLVELRKLLVDAVKEKRLITTGTNSLGSSGPTLPGILGGHAYAVLGYDAGADEIHLWDPHGDTYQPKGEPGPDHGYPRMDGLFSMPLPVFVKQYAGLAFEQFPKVAAEAAAQ